MRNERDILRLFRTQTWPSNYFSASQEYKTAVSELHGKIVHSFIGGVQRISKQPYYI